MVRGLPGPARESLAATATRVAARSMTGRRAMGLRHLERAYARPLDPHEAEVLWRRMVASYVYYWEDALRLPAMDSAFLETHFDPGEGISHIVDAVHSGIGPILALPHLGPWERAAAFIHRVLGLELAAVVEDLDSPEFFEWFLEFRSSLGIEPIPLGPDAASRVAGAVLGAKVVCLLCDRDLVGGGVEVEFFGERTRLPAGPVVLALKTGAPLLPVGVYALPGDRTQAIVGPPLDLDRRGTFREDVTRHTQRLAERLEDLIRVDPTQWHLMQPNWPSDRAVGSGGS